MKYIKENPQLFSDLLAINLGFFVLKTWVLVDGHTGHHIPLLIVFSNLIWTVVYLLIGENKVNRRWSYARHFLDLLRIFAIHYAIVLLLDFGVLENANQEIILGVYIWLLFPLSIGRIALVFLLRRVRSKGYNYKRIVAIGDKEFAQNFQEDVKAQTHYGYKLLGCFDYELFQMSEKIENTHSLDFYQFLIDNEVDEVFVSIHTKREKIHPLLTFCKLNGIVINITHDFLNGLKLGPLDISVQKDGLTPTLTIKEDWFTSILRRVAKRIFDLSLSFLALVFIASWLFPLIAILIRLDSKGPVFFLQLRTGLNHKKFLCFKFRTMTINQSRNEVTPLGKILRRFSLDELPQLFNVVKGEMSLVGPRPHMLKHTVEYGQMVDDYHERLWIKPGITGLAQSLGFRGEIKKIDQLEGRVSHDRDYVKNWSFFLDIKILVFTVWNVLSFQRLGV